MGFYGGLPGEIISLILYFQISISTIFIARNLRASSLIMVPWQLNSKDCSFTFPVLQLLQLQRATSKLISDLMRVVLSNLAVSILTKYLIYFMTFCFQRINKYPKWLEQELINFLKAEERAHRRYKSSGLCIYLNHFHAP